MRPISKKDLLGRKIVDVDNSCVNVLKLTFDNNEKLEVWAEGALNTPYGSIPGFFVEDENDTSKKEDRKKEDRKKEDRKKEDRKKEGYN